MPARSTVTSGLGQQTGLTTGRRVLKGCLITVGVSTLLVGAFIVFLVIQLSGGLPWAFSSPPKETDPEVVAAKKDGRLLQDQRVSELRALGATAALVPVAVTTSEVTCRGEHNWKIKDDFDLQCRVPSWNEPVAHGTSAESRGSRVHRRSWRISLQIKATGWSRGSAGRSAGRSTPTVHLPRSETRGPILRAIPTDTSSICASPQ